MSLLNFKNFLRIHLKIDNRRHPLSHLSLQVSFSSNKDLTNMLVVESLACVTSIFKTNESHETHDEISEKQKCKTRNPSHKKNFEDVKLKDFSYGFTLINARKIL